MTNRNIISKRLLQFLIECALEIVEQIRTRGWNQFVSYLNMEIKNNNVEFYCNPYCSRKETPACKRFIRGKCVAFDAETINSILKTRLSKGCDQCLVFQSDLNSNEMIRQLCVKDANLALDSFRLPRKASHCYLFPVPKIWAAFISSKHSSTVKCFRCYNQKSSFNFSNNERKNARCG